MTPSTLRNTVASHYFGGEKVEGFNFRSSRDFDMENDVANSTLLRQINGCSTLEIRECTVWLLR